MASVSSSERDSLCSFRACRSAFLVMDENDSYLSVSACKLLHQFEA